MPNILDYLDWRGDLSFTQSPFNEVDNVVLCKFICPNFTDIIPAGSKGGGITLSSATEEFFRRYGDEPKIGLLAPRELVPMMRKLKDSVRYGQLLLSDYINRVDLVLEEQFSALTYLLPDGTRFVTFRGTDDTLIAWKENLNMGIKDVVPAQVDAAIYLESIAVKHPEMLRVGGHSKGGNLAVFAAMHLPEEYQCRLLAVYNNDGPGFRQSVLETPEYQRIRSKLVTLVPQYSLVGMLLSHEEEFEVVKSEVSGLMAHDGLTWEVLGTKFVRSSDLALKSRILNSALYYWAAGLDTEKRKEFISDLYDLLTSTGASTLTELTENKLRQSLKLIQKLKREPEVRAFLVEVIELLIKEYFNSTLEVFPLPRLPFKAKQIKSDKKL